MGSDRPQVIAQALTSKFTTMDNMKKIEDVKATGNADLEMWTIGDVYRNREMILADPEPFGRIITQFSADLGLVPTNGRSASLNYHNAGNAPSTGASVPSAAMRLTSTTLLGMSMVVVTGKSASIVPSAIVATVSVTPKGCLIGLS